MIRAGSYPIEDFLEAITAQLDKTQDALRLKAVNRPLTFALKDFNIDLKVFVEMDEQGLIRFRPGGPNETGTSTVTIGFTTITRPMIEENTVSLELTQSPTLEEIGLAPDEQKRLERLGVRNAAQLRRLESQAGDNTLSRMSGVDLSKLRQALHMGRPALYTIGPTTDGSPEDTEPPAGQIQPPPNGQPPGRGPAPVAVPPRVDTSKADRPPRGRPAVPSKQAPTGPGKPSIADRLRERLGGAGPDGGSAAKQARGKINLPKDAKEVKLSGRNLVVAGRAPRIQLNANPLQISKADEEAVVAALPVDATAGVLSVAMPDGDTIEFDLSFDEPLVVEPARPSDEDDPWMPGGGTRS